MMSLLYGNVHNTRHKLVARISRPREFTSGAGGGWRVPPPSPFASARRDDAVSSVEWIQVPVPGRKQQLELRFKQRFTVSPGSVTSTNNDMTGTRVWPTAKAMVSRLSQDLEQLLRTEKSSLRILELGSGCGLLGMTLAAMGNDVLLTDHAGNVDWLRENVELNKATCQSRAVTAVLDWGDKDHMSAIKDEFVGRGFDAIVGTDLIYHPNCHGALAETMRWFTGPTRAPVFLGYPNRDSNGAGFFQIAQEYFDIETSVMGGDESKLMYAVCRIRE